MAEVYQIAWFSGGVLLRSMERRYKILLDCMLATEDRSHSKNLLRLFLRCGSVANVMLALCFAIVEGCLHVSV